MKSLSLVAVLVASFSVSAMAADTGNEQFPEPQIQGIVSVSSPPIVLDTGREAYPRPLVQGNLNVVHTTQFAR